MFVKNLIGARVGEVEDLPFEVAKKKVEQGEAEDVYKQLPRSTAVVSPVVVSTRADSVAMGSKATQFRRKEKR